MDEKNDFCIFCPTPLDNTTKPEHIILSCLGGRKTTKKVICSNCNTQFGSTIDKAVADDTISIRNMLDIKTGKRKSPKSITGVKLSNDLNINIKPGYIPESQKVEFKFNQKGKSIIFDFEVGSVHQLEGLLKQAAKEANLSYEELIDKVGNTSLTIRTNPIKQNLERTFNVGKKQLTQSLTKSCLVLWALAVGNTEVQSAKYDHIRNFITNDKFEKNNIDFSADCNPIPFSNKETGNFGDFFNLAYVSSNNEGRVIGLFRLFNMYTWKVCLAEKGSLPNRTTWLISDPINGVNWKHATTDNKELLMPFSWLNNFENDNSIEYAKEKMIAMYNHYKELAIERELEQIAKDAFSDVLGKQYAESEMEILKVNNYMRHRFFCFITKTPYHRTITLRKYLEEESYL